MILRDDGDIVSDHESSDEQEDLSLVDAENIVRPVQEDVFMAKQTLNIQVKPEGNSQQETIFHSKCQSMEKFVV